ncbi:copper amine oxidase N-terminal domain-containing protein [Pelotomaculum isophthalicicum JI]|uniref:Copper amine oxidase N-terminal domain-containing protein n=1 Tax=Pelotomaculum isophthalicicum JI TaxID=947010 RepID=A0A9X4H575_9FIRM|nr:copper amine oxidase N-terminal domain-containing protein [Pelotomaculum isophthalicicum]MDF9407883.1 copper amine oxidase N-terminal domain-containing protein [Pelotomaculum isophthalicicum JI]
MKKGFIKHGKHVLLITILALFALIPSICLAAGEAGEITIRVNNTVLRPDVPAQIINGRTMVPVRFVAQALDCTVDWDEATLSVLIASGGQYEGSPPPNDTGYIRIYVNGNILYPDVAPLLINGRTMVPVRFIAEALGARVGWDEQSQTVIITKSAPVSSNDVTTVDQLLVGPDLDLETQLLLARQFGPNGQVVFVQAGESQLPINAFSPFICASAKIMNGLAGQEVTGVLDYNHGQASVTSELVYPQSGSRYVGFKFTRQSDQWPTGYYEIKVYVDGVLKAATPFTVE